MKVRIVPGALAVLFLALLQMACGGGSSALNPQFQPQVANLLDNFQFQTTGITNVTQSLSFDWQNSGIRVNVNQACAIAKGTAILQVRDSAGNKMYEADLVNNGTFTSITGATGTWHIDVQLTGVSGTLNFRVQKMP